MEYPSSTAMVYSRALFNVFEDEDLLQPCHDGIVFLLRYYDENAAMESYLNHGLIDDDKKIKTLMDLMGSNVKKNKNQKTIDEFFFNFLKTCGKNKRWNILITIFRGFLLLWEEKNNIVNITVTVSGKDQKEIATLRKKILSDIEKDINRNSIIEKKFIINDRIDQEIMGGIIVETPDRRLDLSLRTQLNRLNLRLKQI